MKKALLLIGLSVFIMLCFCSCKKVNTTSLIIKDGRITTNLVCKSGITVKDALREAEIDYNEKDRITPDLNTIVNNISNNTVNLERFYTVTLTYDGKNQEYTSYGGTVKDIVKKSKIAVDKYNVIEPNEECYLVDGMNIKIYRMAEIKLTLHKKTKTMITEISTVDDFLKSNNITLEKNDVVKPSLNTKIKEGTNIVIQKIIQKKETVSEPIKYSVDKRYDNSMTIGTSKIIRNGINGEKKIKYLVTYTDGIETDRKIISEKIVSNAVNEIIIYGAKEENPIVSKQKVFDCDGSNNGYYIITYADGTIEYQDFYNGG